MKGNPAESGGPLPSRPTRWNLWAFHHVGFFLASGGSGRTQAKWGISLLESNSDMAQQIAEASIATEASQENQRPGDSNGPLSPDSPRRIWRLPCSISSAG